MVRFSSDERTVSQVVPRQTVDDSGRAYLIALSGSNVGQIFHLEKEITVVGRDEDSDIQILDAGISRRHARIEQNGEGIFELVDENSRNGTFANNTRIERHRLQDGDKIQLGVTTVIKFCFNNNSEAQYAQTMYETALRDSLTGVFNRRYFDERLRSEFAYALRHKTCLALLLLDLDHFKKVNDTHGHPTGDEVLKEFAGLIFKTIRTEDVLTRYGGEEFAILCRDTDLIKASVLGERIRHAVAGHTFLGATLRLNITTSIGIAVIPSPKIETIEALIAAADEAMYQAKNIGRNCVVIRRAGS